ncbi:unnamed protein product, partial [Staurois parvus]
MVGTPHNGHSRCADLDLSTGMVGTPHNGHSRCADLEPQHRDGGEPFIMGTAGVHTQNLSTGMVGTPH